MFRTVWHLKDSTGQNHRATTQNEYHYILEVIRSKYGPDYKIEVFATIEEYRTIEQDLISGTAKVA